MKQKTAMLTIEQVPIEALHPDPFNPRRISDAELEALTRSLQQFGFVDPVIARRADETALVAAGIHSRRRAADLLGVPDPDAEWQRWRQEEEEEATERAEMKGN